MFHVVVTSLIGNCIGLMLLWASYFVFECRVFLCSLSFLHPACWTLWVWLPSVVCTVPGTTPAQWMPFGISEEYYDTNNEDQEPSLWDLFLHRSSSSNLQVTRWMCLETYLVSGPYTCFLWMPGLISRELSVVVTSHDSTMVTGVVSLPLAGFFDL